MLFSSIARQMRAKAECRVEREVKVSASARIDGDGLGEWTTRKTENSKKKKKKKETKKENPFSYGKCCPIHIHSIYVEQKALKLTDTLPKCQAKGFEFSLARYLIRLEG